MGWSPARFAQLLHAVSELARKVLCLELGVHGDVEAHDDLVVRVRRVLRSSALRARYLLRQLDVPLDGEIARDELDAVHGELPALDVFAHGGGESVLNATEVLTELAPGHGLVLDGAILSARGGLVRGEDDVAEVELGLHVALELTDVDEVLRVSMEDEELLEGRLEREAVALADGGRELDHGLHTLDLALDDLVEVLLFNRREGEEVDGADVACLGIFGDEFSHPS